MGAQGRVADLAIMATLIDPNEIWPLRLNDPHPGEVWQRKCASIYCVDEKVVIKVARRRSGLSVYVEYLDMAGNNTRCNWTQFDAYFIKI